jgi:hypothetical protein
MSHFSLAGPTSINKSSSTCVCHPAHVHLAPPALSCVSAGASGEGAEDPARGVPAAPGESIGSAVEGRCWFDWV